FVHMYVGEEAAAAGVCACLHDDDHVTSTHRRHGHCIAKGCALDRMMAEIYGRETGLRKGRGGTLPSAGSTRALLGASAAPGGGLGGYEDAREAVERAGRGSGATLHEKKTAGFHGHFTGDPHRYRDEAERGALLAFDPIPPRRRRLEADGVALDEIDRELEE